MSDPRDVPCEECLGRRIARGSYSAVCADCHPLRFRQEGDPDSILVPGYARMFRDEATKARCEEGGG